MSEITFISTKWLQPLVKKISPLEKRLTTEKGFAAGIRDQQLEELGAIIDVFDSPTELVQCYVDPFCQDHEPANPLEGPSGSSLRAPLLFTIDTFLKAHSSRLSRSGRQLFLLSEDGMGKTSLLMLIKLVHFAGFWPRQYDCQLLKLGKDTLDAIWQHPDKANTVLLLDALDEDPLGWNDIKARTQEILEASRDYYRVIISCRSRPLLDAAGYLSDHPEQIRIGNDAYPLVFLTLFDEDQVADYLARRFPNHPCDIFFRCSKSIREQAQHLVNEMESWRFPPLLLAHVHDILAAGPRSAEPYALYLALFKTWIAREETRLRELPKKRLPNPPSQKDLWTIFITMAVLLQRKGEPRLSCATLYRLEKDLPLFANLDHIHTGEGSLLRHTATGDFRFIHPILQEFLVAHGIVTGQANIIGDAVRVTDQLSLFLKNAKAADFPLPKKLHPTHPFMATPGFHFHDRLSDGSRAPFMQPIPVGEFLMGTHQGEGDKSEHPQHRVRIMEPFALGTWPVTFDEYDHFCVATGHKKPQDQGWGRRRHPVIHVSWQDALDYCAWLSRETGHRYRLPSEAEWEYAARAGTRSRYWWGDDFDEGNGICPANCDDGASESDTRQTSVVGSFAHNPFGLYDTAGNIWEWTADCWHDNYQNAPSDSRAWGEQDLGDKTLRVVRGGSWNNAPFELRSASRDRYALDATYSLLGFRVARDL
uniref:Formylglycine-generating enzyme, required for sulfatase activity, contains SUMF1/FGE domain n=1 Tax=Candidatus Kentrum sp. MB TaxID=2138164 RepID=A0A450XI31_9GAMM|nr:MAG: Formylglycine-generating enzyme, required for sulfatase activity, contains SUMF1/FGE domain [Candidatus Kentron sp. MB]VFK33430.1 MAG: Formylglycine-generating enzyme, required for sulfatase activity, contains SUMF1/FGE domain [Candidatus Kentron sp. MB]VFK76164.1 MAG: Formylglycine-generating enzyme, required for sulfatase activity, contains SUMF1/FGE domain [Candidatus Kentron sp. MB]